MLKEFFRELNGSRVEGELIKAVFYSLITSLVTLAILYFVKLRFIDNFFSSYGLYIFLAIVGYALVMPTMLHIRAYNSFPCMAGMMIGMTIGMIAGFLTGFYIGATNGMFIGSISGMALGIFIGIWNGKCCGIMGAMEGAMAGFMGGIMGAMTSVMTLNDHVVWLGIIILIISACIVLGLHYMIYKEMKEREREKHGGYFMVIALSFILTAITTWIMLFGPKSALVG